MKAQLVRYGESPSQREATIAELLRRAERSGMCKVWPAATAPAGWVACDGTVVNRLQYAAIFSVIGTTFGAGDGSTTFGLPAWGAPTPGGIWIMKV